MANEIIFRSGMNRIKQLHNDDAFLISRTDGTHGYILLSEASQFKGDPLTYADLTPIQIADLQRPAAEAAAAASAATASAAAATADAVAASEAAAAAAELASQKGAYAQQQGEAAAEATTTIGERIDMGIAALVGSAPDSLDTLRELAAALGDDPNFATTVTNSLARKIERDKETELPVASSTAEIAHIRAINAEGKSVIATPKQLREMVGIDYSLLTEQEVPGEVWIGADGVPRKVYVRTFTGSLSEVATPLMSGITYAQPVMAMAKPTAYPYYVQIDKVEISGTSIINSLNWGFVILNNTLNVIAKSGNMVGAEFKATFKYIKL